ncbi:solute carrier family 15 member 5-like [Coregonus clupeaformis]|uniref:solute carrier family 15 member 5-like n=1 Tax=Coregonus clupeaformis TaxID=59861 RepID=UPI001E1C3CB9|nr:solute carrier family 15 member 5-like [Coregonus clupeaformis]
MTLCFMELYTRGQGGASYLTVFYWLVNLKWTVVFLGITYIQQSVRAKENNGGRYSETHMENVKVLARLFPLYLLQILYRACITQIPSGYYIQTMNSNLHLNSFLLPIGAMNVISIPRLLLLAPLMECVTSCYLSMEKTPFSPATLSVLGHVCAAQSVLVVGLSQVHRKGYPLTEQALSGKVLQVSSMACFQLAPQYILLGLAEALITPACSVISFHLTPSHIRGISLHFLSLWIYCYIDDWK